MQSRTRYICLIFLPCLFSNDVSNCLHLLSITTHVALFHVETASLLNVLKFQLKCVKTVFLLNVAFTVSQEQFQPMMWCTRDFIFENLWSQPFLISQLIWYKFGKVVQRSSFFYGKFEKGGLQRSFWIYMHCAEICWKVFTFIFVGLDIQPLENYIMF